MTTSLPRRWPQRDRIRLFHRKWYGEFKNADGATVRVPLFEDKTASQLRLSDLVREAELAQVGVVNKFAKHEARTLEHIDDFQAMLKARESTKKQVDMKTGRVRRLLVEWCSFKALADLNADKVQFQLRELVKGHQTRLILTCVRPDRSVSRLRSNRVALDPLAILEAPSVHEPLYRRRHLQEEEMRALLKASAENKAPVYRGLTGPDRHAIYLTAIYTGYRCEELTKLLPESFRLADTVPSVYLPAKHTKNQPQPLSRSQKPSPMNCVIT